MHHHFGISDYYRNNSNHVALQTNGLIEHHLCSASPSYSQTMEKSETIAVSNVTASHNYQIKKVYKPSPFYHVQPSNHPKFTKMQQSFMQAWKPSQTNLPAHCTPFEKIKLNLEQQNFIYKTISTLKKTPKPISKTLFRLKQLVAQFTSNRACDPYIHWSKHYSMC